MLDDLKRSISEVFSDRLTSPVFGTFFISWVAINWRIVLFLFSQSANTVEKIAYIESQWEFWKCVGYPVISAVAVMVIYPWIAIGGFFLWENPKRHKKAIKTRIEEKTVITREEYARLRVAMKQEKDRYDEEIKDGKQVEESYKVLLDQAQNEKANLVNKVDEQKTTIDALQKAFNELRAGDTGLTEMDKRVLDLALSAGDNYFGLEKAQSALGVQSSEALYYLERLLEKNMLELHPQQKNIFKLSKYGRKTIFESTRGKNI